MRDLLLVVPTRGRPEIFRRMVEECASHRALSVRAPSVDVLAGLDLDDPELPRYQHLRTHWRPGLTVAWTFGARRSVSAWTNQLALTAAPRYRYLMAMSDDMVPRTEWDGPLISALDHRGGIGMAYGNDLFHDGRLATAPLVSSAIVQALGYLYHPAMDRYNVDNVMHDVCEAAGVLVYRPDVVIEHMHPAIGKAPLDDTYTYSGGGWSESHPDHQAYLRWKDDPGPGGMAADVEKVRALARSDD